MPGRFHVESKCQLEFRANTRHLEGNAVCILLLALGTKAKFIEALATVGRAMFGRSGHILSLLLRGSGDDEFDDFPTEVLHPLD